MAGFFLNTQKIIEPMDAENKPQPGFNEESVDKDDIVNDDTSSLENEDLNYDETSNSFELDVKSDDPDYDHPDPYNSTAKNGDDINSTYDEANPYAADEYIPNENLETDVDQLAMHIDSGKIVQLDPADEILSRTPEDDRDDLDEEGYPKNDMPPNVPR